MKKTIYQNLKFVLLAVVLGLAFNYVSATTNIWHGPTGTAPGNNKIVVLNSTLSDQKKGGSGVPDLPAMLDIEGTLSGTNVAVWNDANVSADFYVDTLPGFARTTSNRLCVDENHKLVMCTETGTAPVCGNGTVEGGEQCDDSNTADGDGCSHSCQNEHGAGPHNLPEQGYPILVGGTCNPNMTVYSNYQIDHVQAGLHIWEDPLLQIPYSYTTVGDPTTNRTWNMETGWWQNTVRVGPEIWSC